MMRVAVVGGGITGLAAARQLVGEADRQGLALEVTVFEAEDRWGGKIRTVRLDAGLDPSLDDAVVEAGPDAIYTPKVQALQLARELGLGERIVPADPTRRTTVLRDGRMVPVPDGLFSLVPSRLGAFVRSPLVSWPGKLRMGLELVLPPRRDGGDESLGAFVRRRFGNEAVAYLAEPLLAGIHAADPWRLSLLATFPAFHEAELRHGSLVRAALARRKAAQTPSSVDGRRPGAGPARTRPASPFASFPWGLSELVEALVKALRPHVALCAGTRVSALEPADDRWHVLTASPGSCDSVRLPAFDAVILALPSYRSAPLVEPWDPELSSLLQRIPFASTAVVALAFPRDAVPEDSPVRRTSGVLVPSVEARRRGLSVTACSWFSTKWPHASPRGGVLIRCFVGRFGDERALEMSDDALVRAVLRDLRRLAGLKARPRYEAVFRWPFAMPQYQVGHLELVDAIERRAANWPGLYLAGASFRGMGISDCVRQGQQAAQACVAYLQTLAARSGAGQLNTEGMGRAS